jgi:hypothetical protein
MRIGPFNAWVWCESSASAFTFKLSISRNQPDFGALIRELAARNCLRLFAWMFRNNPGVKGRPDTIQRMLDALKPVFAGDAAK